MAVEYIATKVVVDDDNMGCFNCARLEMSPQGCTHIDSTYRAAPPF
jgi:hypothetical protein